MKFLIGLFIIIYEFLLLPVWLGTLWHRKREKAGFCRLYTEGMVTLLSIFFVMAAFAGIRGMKLSVLTMWWQITLVLSVAAMLFGGILQRKKMKNQGFELKKRFLYMTEKMRGFVTFLIVILLFSVTFTMPSEKDDTPEIVNIAVSTDTIYQYQPYTQIAYGGVNMDKAASPVEMLYAVNANITGIEPVVLIHTVLPAFLLLYFFSVCWQVGSYFFPGSLEKREMFVIFVTIFYTAAWSTDTALVLGILQNPWNGVSLAIGCGLPMVLIQGFSIMDYFLEKKKVPWLEVGKTVFMMTAVQLMISKGYFVCVLVLSGCLVTGICRKGMRNAGSIREH